MYKWPWWQMKDMLFETWQNLTLTKSHVTGVQPFPPSSGAAVAS